MNNTDSQQMESYSQYGQDIYCYNNFFKKTQHGVFVEIGADDGVDKSNSLFFEKIGWTGLCIEPSPSRFKLLSRNRKCLCENIAISDSNKQVDFLDIKGWGKGLSGIIENYTQKHISRISSELTNKKNDGYKTTTVQCRPLKTVLVKYGITHIDLCSIDTEGSELDIIKSIDFRTVFIDVFCIENNYSSREMKLFLSKHGYDLVEYIAVDEIYKKRS